MTNRYYDVWQDLPYVKNSPVTVGAYAVSEEGRARWGLFPSLHSDDKFVRLHFDPDERRTLKDCSYQVLLPQNLRQLIRARRRYQVGNRELEAVLPHMALPPDLRRHEGIAKDWLRRPSRWPSIAVFLTVQALTTRFSHPSEVDH